MIQIVYNTVPKEFYRFHTCSIFVSTVYCSYISQNYKALIVMIVLRANDEAYSAETAQYYASLLPCLHSPLGAWDWLRYFIVALPEPSI